MTANPFAALLAGVTRFNVKAGDHTDPSVLMLEAEVLAALAAAVPADLAEAGKVLDEIRRVDPFENPLAASEAEQRAADTIRSLLARIAAQEAQIKGLEAERDHFELERHKHQRRAMAAETALAAERAKVAKLVEAGKPFCFYSENEPAGSLEDAVQHAWEIRYQDRFKDWIDFADITALRAAITEAGQ